MRLSTEIEVVVVAVATAKSAAGREYYQIIGRHNGEMAVIGCGTDDLPNVKEGDKITLPVTVKGDRMDLWVKRQQA